MARVQKDGVDIDDLLSAIRNDPTYKTFRRIVQKAEEKLDIEKDRNEVFALHSARTARKLYSSKMYNPSSLMNAAANDMQARSRIVEIRVKASYHIQVVEKAMESIQSHVITQYDSHLRKYSNQAQRTALIRRVQKAANTLITDGQDLLSLCDAIIGDIDKASYHISTLRDSMALLSQSQGGKVI